jgi:subtilisin family serine protease
MAYSAAIAQEKMSELGTRLPIDTIEKGYRSGVRESLQLVIRNQDEWNAFWKRHSSIDTNPPPSPIIEFNREMVDDCYGIDVANNDSDPMDDNGHGTHVGGTIGAVGNNNVGVVGVNWNVRLMSCKFFDASGQGHDGRRHRLPGIRQDYEGPRR